MKSFAAAFCSPFLSRTASCLIGEKSDWSTIQREPSLLFTICDRATNPMSAFPVSTNWKVCVMFLALHDLGLKLFVDAELLHRFDRGAAVRRRIRIGERDLGQLAVLQGLLPGHGILGLAEQDELADRVGELAPRHRVAIVDGALCRCLVGREEHLEGRALADLGKQTARRAEAEDRLVSGLLLPKCGDFLRRVGEVGGRCDRGLSCTCLASAEGQQEKSRQQAGPRMSSMPPIECS